MTHRDRAGDPSGHRVGSREAAGPAGHRQGGSTPPSIHPLAVRPPDRNGGFPRLSDGAYVAHYNLCRVHEALRMTPAMALGVTDRIWEIGELIEAALAGVIPEPPGERHGRFRVIDGGLA